eukprot:291753-Prymnesium_polylepis.1
MDSSKSESGNKASPCMPGAPFRCSSIPDRRPGDLGGGSPRRRSTVWRSSAGVYLGALGSSGASGVSIVADAAM